MSSISIKKDENDNEILKEIIDDIEIFYGEDEI